MLDQSTDRKEDTEETKAAQKEKCTCFVCKKEVERSQSKQICHPKHDKVWVCDGHMK